MKRTSLESLATFIFAICMMILYSAPKFAAPAAVQRRIMK